MEYKAERASVLTKTTLKLFMLAYIELSNGIKSNAKRALIKARNMAIDQREVADIKSVYGLIDKPQAAMARIADILTCGGRIYDEYSEFLKNG